MNRVYLVVRFSNCYIFICSTLVIGGLNVGILIYNRAHGKFTFCCPNALSFFGALNCFLCEPSHTIFTIRVNTISIHIQN